MKTPSSPDLDLDAAHRDPAAVFSGPELVLQHPDLDLAQKLKILQRWDFDARELAVAEEEGMGAGEPSMLSRVHLALTELRQGTSPPGVPGKHGGA